MKKNVLLVFFTFLFVVFGGINNLFPQNTSTGTLIGIVRAADTKDVLPYATVIVVGTNNGAATDLNGKFVIRNIVAGRNKIKISYVGYQDKIEEVTIQPDKTVDIKIILEPHNIEAKEVVVTAQAQGQLNAINEQISSKNIVNIVAPDRLQENPDANVAEAIGRLPGISLIRSGGEGQGVVIRGLDPKYSEITIDGIQVPSTDATTRSTDISGISQYVLQGVEVYKTLTPDMDGDATAGSINLKLTEAPEGFHYNIMGQGGYNHLNNDYGNYNFQANLSNRFINNKLGLIFNVGSQRVNRSDQNTYADFGIFSNVAQNGQYPPMYLNDINLIDDHRIDKRSSGTLVLDYKYSENSKIVFFNFLSHSSQDLEHVLKGYDLHDAARNVTYLFNQNTGNGTDLYISSLKGENSLKSFDISYGVAFSQTHNYAPNSRTWDFVNYGGVPSAYTDTASRSLPIGTIFNDIKDQVSTSYLESSLANDIYVESEDDFDKLFTAYFDSKITFQIDNYTSANIKFGAKYKNENKTRYYSHYYGNFSTGNFPLSGDTVKKYLSWVDVKNGQLTANGFQDHILENFLNGEFYFGWYPSFDRLNQFFNWYSGWTNYYLSNPNSTISPQILLRQDFATEQDNNYKFREQYIGTYLMGEVDLGDLVTFIPGVRYEKVNDNLTGWYAIQIPFPTKPFGKQALATHEDDYFLPDAQLLIKPNSWMQIHLSYTNSLNRPDYSSLVPITYINLGASPEILNEGNPELKPEHWTNYDFQVAFFNNEIGYLGVNGFYKIAKDVIWTPVYIRVPGDPIPAGYENVFNSNSVIDITQPVNHNYPVFIKGLEFEWQTSFWYLPSPFKYFSLYCNYTIMNSSTKYPRSTTTNQQVGTDSRGRPIFKLVTNYFVDSGPMENQPNNIANLSLGYNYEGLNVWLSYQFSGQKLSGFNPQPQFSVYSLSFQRLDLQITQKLPINNLEAMLNFANINNPTETQKLSGDPRPSYLNSYGWTLDLGLRYQL